MGYSACFLGAMRRVKTADHTRVPDDASIEAQVTLGVAGDGGFALAVRLKVDLPGLSDAQKWALVDGAHDLCPYSLALRGNIEIELAIG